MDKGLRYELGCEVPLVLVAAWCYRCKVESGLDQYGKCLWCETKIVSADVATGERIP